LAADGGGEAFCADEEVIGFGILAFGEGYGDAVGVLRVGGDSFVVEDCYAVEDGGDEDVGEGTAEDLILGCYGLEVCSAGCVEGCDGAAVAVDEGHACFVSAGVADFLLEAGPFDDVDGVGADVWGGVRVSWTMMVNTGDRSHGRLPTLAPVRRIDGARSTMVILAFGKARRRQKAKTLPAMPEPEMRTLGEDMVDGKVMITMEKNNMSPLY
jgi:hypothetical protein